MEVSLNDFGKVSKNNVWPDFNSRPHIKCDTGRSALSLALAEWKKSSNGHVWIPEYVCPSMIFTISALGIPFKFYQDLPGAANFFAPPKPEANDLVIFIHYFGKVNNNVLQWVSTQINRDWFLLEDCVQSAYSLGVGSYGDYAIFSLRKWWNAPDGSMLVSSKVLDEPKLAPSADYITTKRLMAKIFRFANHDENLHLDWVRHSENKLEYREPRQCSWVSQQLLAGIELIPNLEQRIKNWLLLQNKFATKKLRGINPLYFQLIKGEIPLVYPVLIDHDMRDNLHQWLADHHIYCSIHWKLDTGVSIEAQKLSSKILSIPIDQRYNTEDMKRVFESIVNFTRQTNYE